jgi:ABC-type dipeptide/oligopeptide/nickel transport system permease subunit
MTNQQIINIILAIIVGIVSAFSKSIFDKLFAEYKPDTKKIVSRIKRFLLVFFRYLLPISALVSLSLKDTTVDKPFVISFSFILFILVLNIFFDVLFNFYDKNYNKERELFKPTFEIVKALMDVQIQSVDVMKKTMELSKEQLEFSKEIIEELKKKNNS